MGHTRLGPIPKTSKWTEVVSLFIQTEDKEQAYISPSDIKVIAQQAINAAEGGIEKAIKDDGLIFSFYLLTQIALAARYADWQERLSRQGIQLSHDATVLELSAEVQNAIDDFLLKKTRSTDISEMAQQTLGETLTKATGQKTLSLFRGDTNELQSALRQFSTREGFAELGRTFFSGFIFRFLNFFLSRVTAASLGRLKVRSVAQISEFNNALRRHCYQSALLVRDFCGEWFSKTEYQEGINFDNTSRFVAVALKKIQAEIKQLRAGQ